MKNLPFRILIVEDNSDDAELLMRQLTKADLHSQVNVIADGGRALNYLNDSESKAEDLVAIFLDFNLPIFGGLELLKAIRSNARICHLPVIVMTSSIAPENEEHIRGLGASVVTKPVTFAAFAKAVADTFHSRNNFVSATRLRGKVE